MVTNYNILSSKTKLKRFFLLQKNCLNSNYFTIKFQFSDFKKIHLMFLDIFSSPLNAKYDLIFIKIFLLHGFYCLYKYFKFLVLSNEKSYCK